MAITPFKVTDFDTHRKRIYHVLLVINTNLPPILHCFQVMTNYMSNFASDSLGGRFTLTPLLGVIPCEYPDKFTSPETRGIVLPDAENRTIVSSFI